MGGRPIKSVLVLAYGLRSLKASMHLGLDNPVGNSIHLQCLSHWAGHKNIHNPQVHGSHLQAQVRRGFPSDTEGFSGPEARSSFTLDGMWVASCVQAPVFIGACRRL